MESLAGVPLFQRDCVTVFVPTTTLLVVSLLLTRFLNQLPRLFR